MAEQAEANGSEPTTGALDLSGGPDTSPQSIAAGILAELGDKPLLKKPVGRPKKEVAESDDDDIQPPAHLLGSDEPEEEAEVAEEPESTTEATEGDEEPDEPADLDDQLRALSEEYGVPLSDIEDCESAAEAQRFLNRMFAVFARETQHESRNGTEREPAPAAEAVQTKAATALELDLSKYDDDEPVKADLKKLVDAISERDQELERLKQADQKRQEADFQRVQRDISNQCAESILRQSPELFGTSEKQTREQRKNFLAAYEQADVLLRGAIAAGRPPASISVVAEQAVNAKFAKQLAQKQVTAKTESIKQRQQRRSVGAPARNARPATNAPAAKVYAGDMKDDPDILGVVRSIRARSQG